MHRPNYTTILSSSLRGRVDRLSSQLLHLSTVLCDRALLTECQPFLELRVARTVVEVRPRALLLGLAHPLLEVLAQRVAARRATCCSAYCRRVSFRVCGALTRSSIATLRLSSRGQRNPGARTSCSSCKAGRIPHRCSTWCGVEASHGLGWRGPRSTPWAQCVTRRPARARALSRAAALTHSVRSHSPQPWRMLDLDLYTRAAALSDTAERGTSAAPGAPAATVRSPSRAEQSNQRGAIRWAFA